MEKIERILKENKLEFELKEFSQSTKTSKEAAEAIGCDVAQIGKSIIFKGKVSGKPYLIIASGKNRVNEENFSKIIGETIEKGDANFVKEKTGYIIGGVPPFGHKENIETFIDEDLFKFEYIWCAGGTPNSVFKISPKDLLKITNGKIINIK